jgi:ribosomal protein L2
MLIQYKNGLQCFSLLQENIYINKNIYSGSINLKEPETLCFGDSLPLKIMPLFTILSNIETKPFSGSTLCRAGGVSSILIGKTKNKAILKLNSG